MKYRRFEELPVWNDAIDLAVRVFEMTDEPAFDAQGDLRSQLRRAALSISNNVAEGFERGTTSELLTFLYIARGSAGEIRSMLCFCERVPRFCHLESQISNLKSLAESISRQLRAWADHLQNSDVKGPRHLTDATREAHDKARRAQEFWEHLQQIRENAARGAAAPANGNGADA